MEKETESRGRERKEGRVKSKCGVSRRKQVSDRLREQERAQVREEGTSEGKQQAKSSGREDRGEHGEHTALHFLSWFKFNQNLSASHYSKKCLKLT